MKNFIALCAIIFLIFVFLFYILKFIFISKEILFSSYFIIFKVMCFSYPLKASISVASSPVFFFFLRVHVLKLETGSKGRTQSRRSNRRQPRWGCSDFLESVRKGGLGDRFRGLAWDELFLPIAPLVASLRGTLRVQEMHACGRKTGRARRGGAPGRENTPPPVLLSVEVNTILNMFTVLLAWFLQREKNA